MVGRYEEENPNLSYVRVNQNTSPGTGGSIKGFITNGLTASDPEVTNSGILHRQLLTAAAPPPPEPTPFWSESIDKEEDVQQVNSVTPKASDAVPSQGPTVTEGSATAVPAVAVSTTQVAAVASVSQAPQATVISVATGNSVSNAAVQAQVCVQPTRISVSMGVKRPRDEEPSKYNSKVAKITPSTGQSVNFDAIKEIQKLAKDNAALKKKNEELQEKLDLLSKILRDPHKRDLLHAHLQKLQPSTC